MFFKKPEAEKIQEAEAAITRGMEFAGKSEFDKADKEFTKALKIKPDYLPALRARAATYLAMEKAAPGQGYKELAIADVNQAINLNKDSSGVYADRGMVYFETGDYERAIADFTQGIQFFSDNWELYYLRAAAFKKKGDAESAVNDLSTTLELYPGYPPAMDLLAEIESGAQKETLTHLLHRIKTLNFSDAEKADAHREDLEAPSGAHKMPPEKIPPVSLYSDITDDALEILHAQFTEKYGKALNDEDKSHEERRLEFLVKKAVSPEKVEDEIRAVQEFVKEYVYRQLKELALVIFLAMKKRNDYGSMGEQRVWISFMRNILSIPNNQVAAQSNVNEFYQILDECDNRQGNKSGDAYMEFIKNWPLTLFDKTYPNGNFSKLIPVFALINAPYTLHCTHGHYQTQFIFAECETMEYDKYTAYMFRREYIRSPDITLSVAAQPMDDGMMVRRESLEVIAFNKYQQYLSQYDINKHNRTKEHPNNVISDFYKRQVFLGFDIAPDNTVLDERKRKYENVRDTMTVEIEDGVLWNQVGALAYKENLDPIHAAFKNCLVDYNDGIGNIYISVLSDWFPRKNKCQGAMSRFCEIAEFDAVRAVRDLFMYLSDNWFTDENDFMPRTTTVCTGLVVPFLNNALSFDFARIKKEIPVIYALAFKRMTALFEKLIAIIRKSQYQVGIHTLDITGTEEGVFQMYQKSPNARSLEELRMFSPFWVNMRVYLKKFSPVGFEEFEAVLASEALEFESAILEHFTGAEAARYHHSLREYIYTCLFEMGFIPREREKDVLNLIEKVRGNDEYTLAYNKGIICHLNGEDEKALEYYNTALEKMSTAETLYKRGLVNKALKNMEAAISDFEGASFYCDYGQAETDSLFTLCIIELGNLCVETNETGDAIVHYSNALGMEPQNISILLKRGDVYAAAGDYAAAIDDYTEVIKIKAGGAIEAYEKRGAAYEKSGQGEEAAKDNALASYYKGTAFFSLNDYRNAIAELLKALSFQNGFEGALLYLALSYHNTNEYEKALDAYNKILENNPNHFDAWQKRGRINRDIIKDFETALVCFNKAIELRPDLPDAFEDRGSLYIIQKKYEDAIDDYSAAIGIKPTAEFYYKRGIAYAKLFDKDNAIKDYTNAIKAKPDYVLAYLERGFTYNNWGEFDKAIADFTRMAELSPNDKRSYYYRGLAYANKGELQKAIENYTLAIERYPEYFDAWIGRARNRHNSNDFEGSLLDYDEAIRLDPRHIDARLWKAMAYEDLHDYENAEQTYSEILQLFPGNTLALRRRGRNCIKSKRYDDAIKNYRAATISLFDFLNQSEKADMMQKGGEAFLSEKYGVALGIFEQAIKQQPENTLAVYNHALTLILLNRYDEAQSILLEMEWSNHSQDKEDAIIYLSAIRLAASSKAIDDLTLVIKNNPADVGAYLERGKAYQNMFFPGAIYHYLMGRESDAVYAAALDNYTAAAKIEPGNEHIWFGLGRFFEYYSALYTEGVNLTTEAAKYLNQAVENYTKALQLNASFIEALESRAKVYQKLGLDEKAEADLTAAIEIAKKQSI